MEMKAILKVLGLGNGESGKSLAEMGKLKREVGFERR